MLRHVASLEEELMTMFEIDEDETEELYLKPTKEPTEIEKRDDNYAIVKDQ